ncbi:MULTISPECIES: EAL domain-containing protein [unclassified Rhizobium]|uniref:EAL domain-containing protein n=1 Tax=unclassified Rhizobium TaxID=2613769 RepID=UPI0017833AAB|nr:MULTISPECIES: EAL domain-containing protein [unclassified Rhizobium]MBD8687534.1 EAL domain-containing protein [Rhizobium sp. CFBP 13644]MBD8691988.1 EAL domain-containing protein [Rhizobium sp. CFBP 13717]
MVQDRNKAEAETCDLQSGQTRLVWYHSLFWKINVFLVSSVVLAYITGATIGWVMVEHGSLEQWRRQAELNAQVTSSAIRSIYTFIAIDSADDGQITRIISERPLGDDASILDTGFNPADVLAVAAAQTKNNIWLFQKSSGQQSFVSSAEAFGSTTGIGLTLPPETNPDEFFVGLADVGGISHFIAYVPILTSKSELQGAVVTSIGEAALLHESQNRLFRNSAILLVTILIFTGAAVTLIMRKVFKPVPDLVGALSRIARDDTRMVTPFQGRHDEIGRLAVAIETLREAVVEREHLRQVRDVAKHMEHLAHHDPLTGLPNRAFFGKKLEELLTPTGDNGRRFNIMLLDLDRFKSINDGLGHASGDALLTSFAERLLLLMRPGDIAARLGGDEFAVLQVVRKDALVEASKLASNVIRAVARPFMLLGKQVSVGTSIGICLDTAEGTEISELLNKADIALYAAKSEGRGTFRFFKPGMEMSGERGHVLQHDLDAALRNDEFELFYQPIFSVAQPQPVGFEALLRWKHPRLGWVSPADFIPVAEKTGQIIAIGDWVMKMACADIANLPANTFVAVNVSSVQLKQRNFADKVKAALSTYRVPAHRLELELTESAQISSLECKEMLEELRDLGIGIALDDFGTGYSGLSYLLNLPITKIKIDRSFVMHVEDRADSRAVVTNLLQLAKSLGLQTTAEGIENEYQLEFMRLLGCTLGQGYHLARPANIQDIQNIYQSLYPRKVSSLGA